jgi:YebC/PmpR family DNA-binding regulatory protein
MSGHSKWATIKHQKAVTDKKRGRVFSRLSKAIAIAVREGGGDDNPDTNSNLRIVVDKAKASNMPKDNIKRAIDRGAGRGGGGSLETVMYEAFGPGGVAVMIDCVTDNKNRTASAVRTYIEKGGGRLGSVGATSYLFEKKGQILVEKNTDVEEQILDLMEIDVKDVADEKGFVEVITQPDKLHQVVEKIKKKNYKIKEFDLFYNPKTLVSLTDEVLKNRVMKFIEGLDDLDDVQQVYTNADFVSQ